MSDEMLLRYQCPGVSIQRSRKSQNSFWDAFIIQTAIEGSATTLYSEDLPHDQNLDGLRVINPFVRLPAEG
jgi:predicted nucleic acid-binding protein